MPLFESSCSTVSLLRSRKTSGKFADMVKIKNNPAEKAPSNITDSAVKRSAFQRRKQYGAQLKKTGIISRGLRETITAAIPREMTKAAKKRSSASNAARGKGIARLGTSSDLPKFKSSVSRQEMEELGCLPVGILSSGSGFRDQKGTLSFSPHTQPFERTPIRGTPLRGMSLAGQEKSDRVAEVVATLQRMKEALSNETATRAEVLTDLKGLELGRRSTISDIAEFWILKMQLLRESGDRKEAVLAAVQAMFATKPRKAKAELAQQISTMLEMETGESSSDVEQDDQAAEYANNVPGVSDKENEVEGSNRTQRNSQPNRSNATASPERLYTPPDIKTTPMVPARSGSAAKSLRFTPLVASAQRLSTNSKRLKRFQIGTASAHGPNIEKTTPLRRSRRIHSLQPQI